MPFVDKCTSRIPSGFQTGAVGYTTAVSTSTQVSPRRRPSTAKCVQKDRGIALLPSLAASSAPPRPSFLPTPHPRLAAEGRVCNQPGQGQRTGRLAGVPPPQGFEEPDTAGERESIEHHSQEREKVSTS